MGTSYSINLVHILVKFMGQNGIDLGDALKAAKINPLCFKDPEARISTHQFNRIWKAAIHKNKVADMGLCFGREIARAYFKGNILFGLMANAGTLEKAMKIFCRYHLLSQDEIFPKLKIKEELVFFSWETASPEVLLPRQVAEALLCALGKILQYISDDQLTFLEVRFQHGKPIDIQGYEAIFQAPLRFSQPKNEIVIKTSDLDLSVFLSDPTLFHTLEQLAETLLDQLYAGIWKNNVLGVIGKRVARGEKTTITRVASDLAVSPRKLQNRLKGENTSFQKILDQARKQIATRYLEKKIPICDIALLLGFSEQSAFNHAFRRWTGSTPSEYRGQYRENRPSSA